jgi:signal transduction histidine kinase
VLVASRSPGAFTPDDHNMLNAIADMAGTGLQRIDILETLEERVQQRTHDLVVLYNLITIISENWRLQDLLELSLVLTLETVKADRGIIYLVDGRDTPGLKPVIQRGFADGFQIEDGSLPDDELAQGVLKQHKPLSLENLAKDPAYVKFNGLNSYAGIPIMVRGDLRGVFSLFATEKGIFGADEMALLASIADHLGIGIDNSILWEQSRENAALEERNRLARNLHDSVSQLLYSVTLMAGSVKKMLEQDYDMETIRNSVTRLGNTAHQALKEMRLLLYELRPAVIDSEGLVSALQHRIETVEERLGVKVGLQAKGLPDLPNDMEDALYHIALEALNNIVKHAESTTASIQLTSRKGKIVMEISDQGCGFDPNQTQRGQGLQNMRERVQMLGGEIEIISTPGRGTRVITRVKAPVGSLMKS